MRLIDADALLDKTANLEAVALEQVGKYEPSEEPREWHRWTGILQERTAFKYDLMDPPTIEAEAIRHGYWIEDMSGTHYCSMCHRVGEYGYDYCPRCGAKMDEESAYATIKRGLEDAINDEGKRDKG